MSILSDEQLTRHRAGLLALACLQAFFTSGIFYGWASLYTLFLESGVYSSHCPGGGWDNGDGSEHEVCAAQKERLSFIYTVASSVNLCSQLPWGLVLDFLGPRVCNLWSSFLVITGFMLLSLSARGVVDGFLPAMVLVAGGGPGAQISLFHLSELFPPKQKSTVLSVVTGAFQLGFCVFLLWRTAHHTWHISLATLAMLYCVPLALLMLLGGVLWPDRPCIPPGDLDPLCFTALGTPPPSSEEEEEAEKNARLAQSQDQRGVVTYSDIGAVRPSSRGGRGEEEQEEEQEEEEEESDEPLTTPLDEEAQHPQSMEGRSRSGSISRHANITDPNVPDVPLSEEQPLIGRNVAISPRPRGGEGQGAGGAAGPPGGAIGGQTPPDYGSLPDPHSSPSLHYVHRSLHALRASRAMPNLKGKTAHHPFMMQLCSPSFLTCLLWMMICLFWANFYIGTAVEQLYSLSDHDVGLTRSYTSWFTLLLPSGLVGIGVFGWVTDNLGFSVSSALTSLFGVGFALGAWLLPLELQPATFVVYSFFRAFLFACMFAYLAHEFGYRHFGLLSGLVLAAGGALTGAVQMPLERALLRGSAGVVADGGNGDGDDASSYRDDGADEEQPTSFDALNRLQLYCMLATFFFPAYVAIKQRMRASRVEEQIKQHQRQLASVY